MLLLPVSVLFREKTSTCEGPLPMHYPGDGKAHYKSSRSRPRVGQKGFRICSSTIVLTLR